jgi:hypothetical protein
VRKPEGNRQLGIPICRLGVILRWVSEKKDGMIWTRFFWLRIEVFVDGNEPSLSVKCWKH